MVHNITEMLTWLGFYAAVFLAYFYFLRFRNKERMLLIEKGVDVSEIYKKRERKFSWFILGYTILGVGIGAVIGLSVLFVLLTNVDDFRTMGGEVAFLFVFVASLLFGAIGVIKGHTLEQKKEK